MTFTREQRLQTITFGLLLIVVGLLIWQVNSNHNLAVRGLEAHNAICTLKDNIRQRIDDSEQFLHDHPKGISGITAVTIRTSIKNQRATLVALKLHCTSDDVVQTKPPLP